MKTKEKILYTFIGGPKCGDTMECNISEKSEYYSYHIQEGGEESDITYNSIIYKSITIEGNGFFVYLDDYPTKTSVIEKLATSYREMIDILQEKINKNDKNINADFIRKCQLVAVQNPTGCSMPVIFRYGKSCEFGEINSYGKIEMYNGEIHDLKNIIYIIP